MHKGLKIALVVSVIVNVLLLGLVGGHMYKRMAFNPVDRMDIKSQLSPETRNLIGRTFQNGFREIRPLGDEARKARAELLKVLTADEFDEAAFDRAVEKMRGIRNDITDIKIRTTKELAMELPVEDRRLFAQRMAKMIGGGFERHVKRHRKPQAMEQEPGSAEGDAAPKE